MVAFATQSNIQMTGAGLLGRSTASVGKSSRITIGSGLTLSAGVLSNSLDLSGYLPLSGGTLTGALSLGSNGLTCGAITASGNVVVGGSATLNWTGSTLSLASQSFNALGVNLWNGSRLGFCAGYGISDVSIARVNSTSLAAYTTSAGTTPADWTCGGLTVSGPITGTGGLIEQRNGLTAQCFDLFETYTSSTNNGKLRFKATSSGHQIGSARATSGSNRAVQLGHFDAAGAFTSALSIATDGAITASGAFTATGTVVETALGYPRLSVGVTGSTPRMVFEGGGSTIYQIDNFNGTFRWFVPGSVRMSLSSSGDLTLPTGGLTASGNVNLTSLPTSDPGVSGRVWRDGTTLKISV